MQIICDPQAGTEQETQQTGVLHLLKDLRATVSIANLQTLLRLTSTAIFNSIRGITINSHKWELINSDASLGMQRACVSMAMTHRSSTWVIMQKIKLSSVYLWMTSPSPYILDAVMTKT